MLRPHIQYMSTKRIIYHIEETIKENKSDALLDDYLEELANRYPGKEIRMDAKGNIALT